MDLGGRSHKPVGRDLPPLTERPGYNANPNDWVRYANHLEASCQQLEGAVEALREIADLPHNSATDSQTVAAERARIARDALNRLGGR